MKNIFIILLILIVLSVSGLMAGKFLLGNNNALLGVRTLSSSNPSITGNVLKENIGLPRTIRIPKINVNTYIEHVGQDKEGKMDIPKEDENTAWYNLGYKVGEKGSAVIAGHYDTKTGTPAVFYNLNKLEVGDEIIVIDDKGWEYKFKVERKALYETEKFPLNEVFAANDKVRLNLITCDGVYNSATRSYSRRMVVYAVAN